MIECLHKGFLSFRQIKAVIAAILLFQLGLSPATAQTTSSQGIVECTSARLNKHNPDIAANADHMICFEGYVSNFNTAVAVTVNRRPRYWATPHWVAQHIARANTAPSQTTVRIPGSPCQTCNSGGSRLPTQAMRFPKRYRKQHSNWYERGHLAQKYLTERVSRDAAWFTHNVANAVPQRGQFNKATWLTLECFTGAWANKYGEVWVMTGPIFKKGRVAWLRSDSNKRATPVAIPSSLFKIVLRNSNGHWEALSFVMPQTHRTYRKGPFDPAVWFKSVAEIERMTGERFFMNLGEAVLESKQQEPTQLWSASEAHFDPGCKNQKTNIL